MVPYDYSQTSSVLTFKKCTVEVNLVGVESGGVHAVIGCFGVAITVVGSGKQPNLRSRALFSTCSSGTEGFPSLILFLLFHKVQATDKNSSGSLPSAQTTNIISKKLLHCLMVLWHHKEVLCQRFSSFGQWYKAWAESSVCRLHSSHTALVTTWCLSKFVLVGSAFLHACHTKCLTFPGTFNPQIFF